MRKWQIAGLLALALWLPHESSAWIHGSAALSPAAVTCNVTTGTCTGTGGGSALFTAATCNGSADDNAAFTSFKSWAVSTWQGSHTGLIELDIPHSAQCMFIGNGQGNAFASGIKQFRLVGLGYSGNGDGATISNGKTGIGTGGGNGWFLASLHGQIQDNAHSARLQSSGIGDTCVTLITAAQASLFTAGNYVLVSGIDMQHGGFPANPYYYEYPKISSIDASHKCDGSAGASVTFTASLVNAYLSTWPIYNAGNANEVDQGGPSTLYALDSAWDTDQTYVGINFDMPDFQTYAIGRNIAYNNVKFTGGSCTVPTQDGSYSITNGDLSSCNIEFDKINGTVSYTNVTLNQANFQSSSVNQFTVANSTISASMQGTPKKFSCSGSTIVSFQVGAHAFGRTSEVDVGNCAVTGMTAIPVTDDGDGSGTGGTSNPGFNFTREMSSGIIKAANTVSITNAVDQGAGVLRLTVACLSLYATCTDATTAFTVGQYYELSNLVMSSGTKMGNYSVAAKNSGAHTVDINLNVASATYTSGGNIGAAGMSWAVPGTNMTFGGTLSAETLYWQVTTVTQDANWTLVGTTLAAGFPTIPNSGKIFASVHPAPKFTCSGCSGDDNAIAFGLDPSHGPYASYFQRTFTGATSAPIVPVSGNVSQIEINITAANSAGGSPTFNFNGPFIVNSSGATTVWDPTANANVTGDRKITLSGVTCNGSAGACSGDTNLTVPDSTTTILSNNQITAQYTGTCTGCSTTLTIQTNQGVVYP